MKPRLLLLVFTAVIGWWALPDRVGAAQHGDTVEIVRDGKPVAVVVSRRAGDRLSARRGQSQVWDEWRAAEVLVDWVKKMTGVTLPLQETVPTQGPAILVGTPALEAGLSLDDLHSPSNEGFKIRVSNGRVLIAGQSGPATVRAVCRLLESWGCRYFMDHPLGEVFPRQASLAAGHLDITESPGFLYRSIWGSQWTQHTLWKIWNGAGGPPLETGHAWGRYVPQQAFEEHPEFFALRGGQRQRGEWYCTSNPGLRDLFTRGILAAIENGHIHPSLSPPDGRGYCECEACRAQDDPSIIEPSSGRISVTPRYVDFFQDVARRVKKVYPDSLLSFYCYADYTQAPAPSTRLEPNLCPWIAPIRYCRFHRIGSPRCLSRQQLASLIQQWSSVATRFGYRAYNYNLAECLVPFSMLSVWQHDIPFLAAHGCLGINLESLPNWQIYGPHIYLSIRLAYDPHANAEAIMDDYFVKFYGPQAGPMLKEYWLTIDRAFAELNCHTGSYYAVHLVFTPKLLQHLRQLLETAQELTRDDPVYRARIEMTAEGLKNAAQYEEIRQLINRGEFAKAHNVYRNLLERTRRNVEKGLASHYTSVYLERFIGPQIEAGVTALTPPHRLVAVLPDRWRMNYDPEDNGLTRGYHLPDFDDSDWHWVETYSRPLDAQGFTDRLTILWYRTNFAVPRDFGRLTLFFTEIDGDATVFVNGKEVGRSARRRQPFEVEITSAVRPGYNLVAVRVDHTVLSELFLGGIVRPVLLIAKG